MPHVITFECEVIMMFNVTHLFHWSIISFSPQSPKTLMHLSHISMIVNSIAVEIGLRQLKLHSSPFCLCSECYTMSHSVSWSQFLLHQNFNRCSIGANAPLCLGVLCWKIRMLQCNKWAAHNVVMSSYLICMMLGTILIGHQLYKLFLHHCWKGANHIEVTHCYSCQLRYVWVVLVT